MARLTTRTGVAFAALTALASSTADADWRADADARIAEHRQRDAVLVLRDGAGRPLADARVRIEQTRQRFLFGTAITPAVAEHGETNDHYRRFILDHFNALVCENAMKWYHVEPERDRLNYDDADASLTFAEAHGLAMRGHCLLWSKPRFVQDWVKALPADELRAEMDAHLVGIVTRYRGRLIAWDVINEMLDGSLYRDRLGPDARAEIFRRVAELDPDTPLFVNEYHILDSDERVDRLIALVRELQSRGANIGGIGIQEHGAQRTHPTKGELTPERIWRRLDRVAELGLPIHLTEISFPTQDEAAKAEALEVFFRAGYAHPAVEAILLWGFWGGRHWMGEKAAIVAPDWTPLPAGERLSTLLRDQWRTRLDITTDHAGRGGFRGFHGTYVATTDIDGQSRAAAFELTPGDGPVEIELTLSPGEDP